MTGARKSKERKRRKYIGIIAEDMSDVEVIHALIRKITNTAFNIQPFAPGGCGKIKSKANAWARNLFQRGCKYLLLVHDLDDARLPKLKGDLVAALGAVAIRQYLIVIPVREIEAWLLADHEAIGKAMNLKSLKRVSNPEGIPRPKEYLRNMIFKSNHKTRYVNTIHNKKIAAECAPDKLAAECASFVPFRDFVERNI